MVWIDRLSQDAEDVREDERVRPEGDVCESEAARSEESVDDDWKRSAAVLRVV